MSETTDSTTEVVGETSADTSTKAETATVEAPDQGESALGDAGKKALDAMKAKWRDAEALAKANAGEKARADALQAKLDGTEAEYAAVQERAALEQAALSKANDRIRRSEVKAAAKGVLADPADAYKFLDLDSFEVDNDGNVDEDAIAKALADLVASKPYLAAQGGKRFQGTADGGARNGSATAAQLSKGDLAGMTPEAIVQAKAEGRLNDALGIKS